MRTLRLAAIAVALATFVSPLRADDPGTTPLRITGVNGRIPGGIYLGPYQAVLGNTPGMPAIDMFSVNYLNHSYTGRNEMGLMGGTPDHYGMATLPSDQFARTVGTSLPGATAQEGGIIHRALWKISAGPRSDVARAGYLMRSEPRVRPKPPVPGRRTEVITTTPEPEAILLMGTGLLVLLAFARTRGNA